ncbi:MAG: helix-turn-helix domain-containing protein [Thermomicrobiales bacterium]
MIDVDKRMAIYQLHQAGMALREISRQLQVSRQTVRTIVKQQGKLERRTRTDKITLDEELLQRLHRECQGWAQRIHERLEEEFGIDIGYSTLTRHLRALGLSQPTDVRCDRVPDEPGAEMQHDTSTYQVKLGTRRTHVIASVLYLRYSKRRYLKFYRSFDRFAMKCFLHEALMHWRYAARQCVIDNTNLARLRGVGRQAIIVPAMEAFAKEHGFQFICHELGHSNRKAGNERSFWTVETNFFPGRVFQDLADLNAQALEWATVRMEHRPLTRARVIPAKLFEHEQHYLHPLPAYLPAPYREQERDIDQYGYLSVQGNHYWVPGKRRCIVKVLIYAERIRIFADHECLAEYPLEPTDTRGKHVGPAGQPIPRCAPRPRQREAKLEDQHLRCIGREVGDYLDFVCAQAGVQRHRFTRALFALSRQLPKDVFVQAILRAHRYQIVEFSTVERIAWLCVSQAQVVVPDVEVDEWLAQRPAYQEGYITDLPRGSEDPAWPHENKETNHEDRPW